MLMYVQKKVNKNHSKPNNKEVAGNSQMKVAVKTYKKKSLKNPLFPKACFLFSAPWMGQEWLNWK